MSKISRGQKHIHLRKYCLKYIIYTLLLLELKHSMKSTPRMMLTQNLKLKHWLESKTQQNVGNILQIRCKNKLKQGQHLQQSTNYTLIKLWIDKWYDRLFAVNITISRETIMVFLPWRCRDTWRSWCRTRCRHTTRKLTKLKCWKFKKGS